ncbi:AsmA family protein [Carnimonas bestiolae]|uniref:AsmA family protein n=1 Tax=Carnimonas bestiolae TaxID=3402172 RepID=UPI003EDB8F95
MKKAIYALLALVGAAIIALAGVAMCIQLFFDPATYAARFEQRIAQHTGLVARVDGSAHWKLFPHPAIAIDNVRIQRQGASHSEAPLARIDRVTVGVSVASLIHRNVKIDSLSLYRPRVDLLRDADGGRNWRALASTDSSSSDSHDADSSTKPDDEIDSTANALNVLRLDLAKVEVIRGTLRYRDRSPAAAAAMLPATMVVSNINASASNLHEGDFFPVNINADIAADNGTSSHVQLKGNVNAVPSKRLYALQNVDLTATSKVPWLSKERSQYLKMTVAGIDSSRGRGDYNIDDVSIEAGLYPDLLNGYELPLTAHFNVSGNSRSGDASIQDLSVNSDDGWQATGNLTARDFPLSPRYSGNVTFPTTNLRTWLTRRGIDPQRAVAGPNALSRVALSAQVEGDTQYISFPHFSASLDKYNLSGEASKVFAASGFSFDVKSPMLNLDRYLPGKRSDNAPQDDAEANKAHQQAPRNEANPSLNREFPWLGVLRQVDMQGKLALGALVLKGARFRHVEADINNVEGYLSISHLSAAVFGGKLSGSGALDARQRAVSVMVSPHLEQWDLGQALNVVNPQWGGKIDGKLDLSAQLMTSGRSFGKLIDNLAGSGKVTLSAGRIRGIDVGNALCRGASSALPTGDAVGEASHIERLNADFTLNDGVVSMNDAFAAFPQWSATGNGQASFNNRTFIARVLARSDGKDAPHCLTTSSSDVPMRCHGGFDDAAESWCAADRYRMQ